MPYLSVINFCIRYRKVAIQNGRNSHRINVTLYTERNTSFQLMDILKLDFNIIHAKLKT
jgi:hypothetical protein